MLFSLDLNPIHYELFWGLFTDEERGGAQKPPPHPRICHTYPTMMKLGTRGTPLGFCWHQNFLPEISKFSYVKKYRHRFHLDIQFLILLTFIESLRLVLINMIPILMMSPKMVTPGLLKANTFLKKRLWLIISANDVTITILSRDSIYNANVVMWPKL